MNQQRLAARLPLKFGRRFNRQSAAFVLVSAALLALGISGCGGGGNTNPNPNPGGNPSNSQLAGTVTDINAAPFVGATVTFAGQTTSSTGGGTYAFPVVTVPANQASIVGTISATQQINGKTFSGQNTVEVLTGEPITSNVHIVLSDNANQGAIGGTVRDSANNVLRSARVFAAPGPVTGANAIAFTNLGSFTAYTDQSGRYTIQKLPVTSGGNAIAYTVTASYAGHSNQTATNVTLLAGQQVRNDFNLPVPSQSAKLPLVQRFSALTFTSPQIATRAAGTGDSAKAYEGIRNYLTFQKMRREHRAADAAHTRTFTKRTRVTPAGTFIETDLFWDYTPGLDNLFGYDIVRSIDNDTTFVSIATLRDPLADRYSDIDPLLTPGTKYYYSVARLDTINFPNGNDTSSGDPVPSILVQPLDLLTQNTPTSGSTVNGAPQFAWKDLGSANVSGYQVLLYDRFPDYQSDSQGVPPLWPADPNNASNAGLVNGNVTSLTYTGPSLISGHTYYWTVIAEYFPGTAATDVGNSYSISPIQSFKAQ